MSLHQDVCDVIRDLPKLLRTSVVEPNGVIVNRIRTFNHPPSKNPEMGLVAWDEYSTCINHLRTNTELIGVDWNKFTGKTPVENYILTCRTGDIKERHELFAGVVIKEG